MPRIDITWEDKMYYNNTTSTSYGNPVTAFVTYGPDGRPDKRCLTKPGLEYFYGKEEPAATPVAKPSSKGGSKSSSKSSSGSKSSGGGSSASEAAPPRPPRPLSPQEIELLELDIESYEVPELHRYLPRLLEHYYNVKGLCPEIDEEIEWRSRKLKEFKNYMCSCPVPEDAVEFFYTLIILEKIQLKKCAIIPDDIFVQGVGSATKGVFKASMSSLISGEVQKSNEEFIGEITAKAPLLQRMQQIAYMNTGQCSNPLKSQEVFDIVWDLNMKDDPIGTNAYTTVAKNACKALCDKGDVPSLKKLLELDDKGKMYANEYLGKIVVPNGNKEEFMEAFTLLNGCKNSNTNAVKKKLSECKDIILANYSDDAKLMEFVAAQAERELRDAAKMYKIVKMASLALCVLLSFVTAFFPLIIWVLLFCVTAIHDKIPFLKNGKDAVAQVKEIDAKK